MCLLFVSLSLSLSLCVSVCLFVSLSLSVCLPVSVSLSLSLSLCLCLSLSLSVCRGGGWGVLFTTVMKCILLIVLPLLLKHFQFPKSVPIVISSLQLH